MDNQYLSTFFELLNTKQIKYCVLRNYKKLPKSTGGSDLDILIHEQSINNFNTLFNHFLKNNNLNLISVIDDKKCPKYCIHASTFGIQMDVFRKSVYFGNKEIIPSSFLFDNTELYKDIKVLNSKVGALLAFLKELLNNKSVKKKYIKDLQDQFVNDNIQSHLLCQFTKQFIYYLNRNLDELDKKKCEELYQLTNSVFFRPKFYNFFYKIKRIFNQPGYSIAFLGTDGSGKSTIIKNITPILNKSFHKSVYYEHMRPNKFPSIAKLLGKNEEITYSVSNPHNGVSSGFFGSLARLLYYSLDYTFGFYIKIWPKKAIRSCVWIFDRYYYDYLIDPKRGKIKLPKWIFKVVKLVIPKPDLILCLGTDPQVIHKRKPELDIKEVKRQVFELKKFYTKDKRAVWIDTGKDINSSSNDAVNAIINMMAKRFQLKKII